MCKQLCAKFEYAVLKNTVAGDLVLWVLNYDFPPLKYPTAKY